MGSRETNAELSARELLEDRLTAIMRTGSVSANPTAAPSSADSKTAAASPSKKYFVKLSTRSPKDAVAAKKVSADTSALDVLTQKLNALQVIASSFVHYHLRSAHSPLLCVYAGEHRAGRARSVDPFSAHILRHFHSLSVPTAQLFVGQAKSGAA
jgi:hypothetical protein